MRELLSLLAHTEAKARGGIMSAAATADVFRPWFRRRLAGFDREEVLTFCNQLIREYERATQELERAQRELQVARDSVIHQNACPETASQAVERIVRSAQRVADEIEHAAKSDAEQLLADARARAASVVQDAEHQAAGIIEDAMGKAEALVQQATNLVQSAEHRAAGIIEDATGKAADLAQHVINMQTRYAELRAAFERAADTAASALNEVAARELRSVPVEVEKTRD
jgi:cell division septum initiation protein DivIVA